MPDIGYQHTDISVLNATGRKDKLKCHGFGVQSWKCILLKNEIQHCIVHSME